MNKIFCVILALCVLFSTFILTSCEDDSPLTPSGEERSSESSEIEIYPGIPELRSEKLTFTLELTQTVYTTTSEKINYRIRSKEPCEFLNRGDKWLLYRIENEEAFLIGEVGWEPVIEYTALDGEEYIERDGDLSIKLLCGNDNLTVGKYCLVYPIQVPDENGYYQTYSGALMYFEVVE